MDFEEVMDLVARAFEVLGVAILVLGALASIVRAVARRETGRKFYRSVRTDFGHTLLLGLEVLVAADIVKTVAVDSTLESVAILGILVLVRTLLSISLDAEIDGVWPWRRRRVELEESQALRR
jgi:uncharacterized membrane protein